MHHTNIRFNCENCDKTFVNEDTKEMHNAISHKNVRFYCHYFNNGKHCPFETECVFLHEVSKVCRYSKNCERDMCMFRHPKEDDTETKNDETVEQSEILDVDDEDKTTDHQIELPNMTFNNPSQIDKYSSDTLFKCETCGFASSRQEIIENHKELLHNWCAKCYSTFDSQKKLKSHIKDIHTDN